MKKENGDTEKQVKYFYGYKVHMNLNGENGLITTVQATSGKVYDGHHFIHLVEHDLDQDLPIEIYTANKGYDDGNNHYYLEFHDLHSEIRLIRTRTMKKEANKEVLINLKATPEYQAGLRERYKIEHRVGEAKQSYGLGRCRYIGTAKFAIRAILIAMVLDLKGMVKILTGVGFKTPVSASLSLPGENCRWR